MMDLNKLVFTSDISIKEAIKKIDESGKKFICIVDDKEHLIGVVTDGDFRRWILKNGKLDENVTKIMNSSPIFVYEGDEDNIFDIMKNNYIDSVPVLNKAHRVVKVVFWNDNFNIKLCKYGKITNKVVIMAGGQGSRLYPYTKILPKPLIPIGDTPIVERIINRFTSFGCTKFYLTVNYKKNMIKAYFNEMEKNYQVEYIEEAKSLGTAGSLSLLKGQIDDTFFLSNCDILIDGNYSDMLKYHKENKNKITVVTSLKHYTIPYGVIEISVTSEVQNMVEKPEYNFLVNTGMYIMEPETLDDIPDDTFYHITELIEHYIQRGEKVGTYPVSDNSWLDMGQFKEMENMIERLELEK